MTSYVVASSKNWFKEHPKTREYKNLNIVEIREKNEAITCNCEICDLRSCLHL